MMGLKAVVIFVTICAGDGQSKCRQQIFAPVTPNPIQDVKEFCDDFMLGQINSMSKSPALKNLYVKDYKCMPQQVHIMLPDSLMKRLMR